MMTKTEGQPHARRRGWLKSGNPPGDLSKVPRCGAKTRRGTPCRAPAMKNGRCRMHGGGSTGPLTRAGLERMRQAKTKHGLYAAATLEFRRLVNRILREAKAHLRSIPMP